MERSVIDDLEQGLHISRRRRGAIARELRAHLEDSRRDLEIAGIPPEQAARQSLERLGDPHEIADGFDRVYRPSRRSQLGLAMALATAMLLGVWGIGGQLANAQRHTGHVTTHLRHHRSRSY